MKYFIVYFTFESERTEECYIKEKSMDILLEQIKRYAAGWLITSKEGFCLRNVLSAYVRELDLTSFPTLIKRDFSVLNETKSLHFTNLMEWKEQ